MVNYLKRQHISTLFIVIIDLILTFPSPAWSQTASPNGKLPPAEKLPGETQTAQEADNSKFASQETLLNSNSQPATTDEQWLKNTLGLFFSLQQTGWQAEAVDFARLKNNMLVTANDLPLSYIYTYQVPILREYGCNAAVWRQFKRGQRLCTALLLQFATPDGAAGAYTVLRQGSSNVVTRGGMSSESDDNICFVTGSTYVTLFTNAQDDDEAKGVLTQLADLFLKKLDSGTKLPALFTALPAVDKVRGSEKLFMGPVAARRWSNFPYIGKLMIDKSGGAISADYLYSAPYRERLHLLIIQYNNEEQAKYAYKTYTGCLSAMNEPKSQTTNRSVFKINDAYLLCQYNRQRLSVISGARKSYASIMLARQLGN